MITEIIQPNNGEILTAGELYPIKWNTIRLDNDKCDSKKITMECSFNYKSHFIPSYKSSFAPIAIADDDTGEYTWTVPDIPTDSAVITIGGIYSGIFKIKGYISTGKGWTK